ncbi:NYN domain-containing protein [Nodosilinea sp. FACHB-131]|uniref:NYN domain-containing protein n=1 Tax=Cyanophyceae TaxID=3028117 RepID=UPI0016823168|nr:NYN domain-containing protein [Nodosilinea sp. FACHB-131]MBD1872533.1 NYN domain-containing protein [Nodosilinea sp. FACHB-131]
MTRSPEPPTPEHWEKIARFLHTVLLKTQQQRVDLLTEAGSTWLQATSAESQINRLTAMLEQQPALPALTVERILAKLFIPAFQGSKPYDQILQRVQQLAIAAAASAPSPEPPPRQQTQDGPPNLSWVGLLLVDAENMNPPEALEAFLQTVGQYPIRHRLAFGNWRKLGRRDQVLYQRGYQMVHVPSGKNSADIKMSLDASLISLWNPSIREVFICSTDSDMLHLGHTLLHLGVTPYRVSRRHNRFSIFNVAQQTAQVFHLSQESQSIDQPQPPTPNAVSVERQAVVPSDVVEVPSLGQMKWWLKVLIMQEQQAKPGEPITLGRLGHLFRDRNHISASEALKANSGYRTLRHFLEDHDGFELSRSPDGQHIVVTLATPAKEKTSPLEPAVAIAASPEKAEGAAGTVALAPPPITDAHSLEQALITLLWRLSSGQTDSQIQLSVLATYFAHIYQEPMSAVLKRIGEPKGLPKFLAKCRSLKVQQQGQDWRITLACVS